MSKLFKQQAAYLRSENKLHSECLIPLDITHVPEGAIAVWRSNRFLVQLFAAENGAQRITINRTMVDEVKGGWLEGITWQEIQDIKRRIGFGHHYAVEIYPAEHEVINVANMRHIWLIERPAFAWPTKK